MKHVILDPQCLYDPRFKNYRFHMESGAKSECIKVNDDVKLNDDYTCQKNKFYVVKTKTGSLQIMNGSDTSQRCLTMMSANPKNEYERIEIDTDKTTAQILETYNILSNKNGLKIVCILAARRPLTVKYTNTLTGKVRYEMSIYDAIDDQVYTRELTAKQLDTLLNDTTILQDGDFDTKLVECTAENFNKWTPEIIAAAEKHYANYYSKTRRRRTIKY